MYIESSIFGSSHIDIRRALFQIFSDRVIGFLNGNHSWCRCESQFSRIEFDCDTVLIGGFVHNTCVALVPLVSS